MTDEKRSGTQLIPLTMEDFGKETIRGKRVFAEIKVGVNYHRVNGVAGWTWSADPTTGKGVQECIVRFDTGIVITINERNVGRFYLEPAN